MESGFDINSFSANPDRTFDNYVEGPCNRNARFHAIAISGNPGDALYSPFTVFSQAGFGKSHLVEAMYNKIISDHQGIPVIYINSRRIRREFSEPLHGHQTKDFWEFCKKSKVLIIDDLDCLEGNDKIQRSVMELFDFYKSNGRQVIFAMSPVTENRTELSQNILKFVRSGLSVYVDQPDNSTRLDILKHKAIRFIKEFNIDINDSVLEHLAESYNFDIRTLEGILASVFVKSYLDKIKIDIPLAKYVIDKHIKESWLWVENKF